MTATGTRDGTPAASSAAVPTGRVAALFTPEAKRQRWLEVEAALALAEADAGMVPREAADAIAAHARLELLDYQRMRADEAISGHVMMPVIDALAEAAGPEHGGWVHWGATTQNIQQSGDTVGIAQAHRLLVGRLEQVLRRLAGLAEEHADTLMAGRTHGQQAVPITFGYKAAVWADRMADHLERLRQAEPRLAVAMLAARRVPSPPSERPARRSSAGWRPGSAWRRCGCRPGPRWITSPNGCAFSAWWRRPPRRSPRRWSG